MATLTIKIQNNIYHLNTFVMIPNTSNHRSAFCHYRLGSSFLVLHINRVIGSVLLCVWLPSLSMVCWGFVCVVAGVVVLSFLLWNGIPLCEYVTSGLPIYLLIDVSIVLCVTLMNKLAISIHGQLSYGCHFSQVNT